MGKPTGFLEYTRREDGRRPAAERVRDWEEFHLPLSEEIRRQQGTRYFALASRENGFLSGLPDDVIEKIAELDGQIIDPACPESLLAGEISERLGFS